MTVQNYNCKQIFSEISFKRLFKIQNTCGLFFKSSKFLNKFVYGAFHSFSHDYTAYSTYT